MKTFFLAPGAVLVRYPGDADAANLAAVAHAAALRSPRPAGLLEAIPAAETTLVLFEPGVFDLSVLGRVPSSSVVAGKRVAVPMRYHDDFAPKLRKLHASARYRVAFIGFAPGFPYLVGLPDALRRPRLASPRTRVPAGSVAIADTYCGIYPSELPGGWNLIGRTALRLFDQTALLAPGDEVVFEEGDATATAPDPAPVLPVRLEANVATLQGGPRHGLGHLGVPPGGAMDLAALEDGNRALGNAGHAAALEFTLQGTEVEFPEPMRFCLSGAPIAASLEGREVSRGEVVEVRAGQRLRLGRVEQGVRSYLCLGKQSPGDKLAPFVPPPAEVTLRVEERREGHFTEGALRTFYSAAWRSSPESDRRGIRLSGPRLEHAGAVEIPPEGNPPGAVQVPGSGQPIILGVDRPVTGGYPKIADVYPEDLAKLAQARPGTLIRFQRA